MRKIFLALAVLLSGCTSLQYAGNASYHVTPFMTPQGAICCVVDAVNGKDIGALKLHVVKSGENYDISLEETSVEASKGIGITAGFAQGAVDAGVKTALAAVLTPAAIAALPAIAAGGATTVLGGAALGVAGTKIMAPTVVGPLK